jgi:hypothetical protein
MESDQQRPGPGNAIRRLGFTCRTGFKQKIEELQQEARVTDSERTG